MITNSGLNYFRVVFLKSFEQITSNLLKLTIEQRNVKGFFYPLKMKGGDILCICDKPCKMKPNKPTRLLSYQTKILLILVSNSLKIDVIF